MKAIVHMSRQKVLKCRRTKKSSCVGCCGLSLHDVSARVQMWANIVVALHGLTAVCALSADVSFTRMSPDILNMVHQTILSFEAEANVIVSQMLCY